MGDAVVRPGGPIGRISPRLYGTFAEHLGRCCYDGLWVGTGSPIANVDGFNAAIVEALRELPTTLIRWPGGCYADHYHWRDGIGKPGERPGTLGTSCGLRSEDTNTLGSHEFMRFCELIGAEPYLAGNVGTGSVQELCDWITYMNSDVDSALTRLRAANGRASGWGVKLWGVGNESWDCGGKYDAVSYALEFRRYATMIDHVDPGAEMVAVGLEDRNLPESHLEDDWNEKLLETLGPNARLMDHLSVHKYWLHGGPELTFNESQYYGLLAEADETEGLVTRTAETIARLSPDHHIGVSLDEWGVWHPEAREWGPMDGATPRPNGRLEQANTLRDAIAAAVAMEGLHRQCNALSMANMAQTVNVLQALLTTDAAGTAVKTPTYHVYALHRPHLGATALATRVDGAAAAPDGGPSLSATCSRSDRTFAATLVNRHFEREATATIAPPDEMSGLSPLSARVLTGKVNAENTVPEPDAVAPRPLEWRESRPGEFTVTLPAHSVATIEFGRPGGRS